MYWCLIYCYMFGISKCHHQGVRYEHAEMVSNVVKSREGWELYIVTDVVCHNIQLPSFSAFHNIGNQLSMFILDSLMMVFWNAKTCSSILSTNTLNEWCICWSFTQRNINVVIVLILCFKILSGTSPNHSCLSLLLKQLHITDLFLCTVHVRAYKGYFNVIMYFEFL
jgi:hypothetical protein